MLMFSVCCLYLFFMGLVSSSLSLLFPPPLSFHLLFSFSLSLSLACSVTAIIQFTNPCANRSQWLLSWCSTFITMKIYVWKTVILFSECFLFKSLEVKIYINKNRARNKCLLRKHPYFLGVINFTTTQQGEEEKESIFSYSKGFCNVLISFSKQN